MDNSADHDDLTAIKISTARIEEQIKALTAATSLQHRNLSDQMVKLADKTAMDDIEARVSDLEAAQGWVIKGVLAAGATALMSLSGIARKIGL